MHLLPPLLTASLLVLPAFSAAEGGRSVTKTYVAATFVPPETECTYNGYRTGPFATPQAAYQQACFDVQPGEESFSILVDDASPFKVAGWYLFTGADGRTVGTYAYFCDAAGGEIPEGAAQLFVVLWGFDFECPGGLWSYHVTTTGNLTATFR